MRRGGRNQEKAGPHQDTAEVAREAHEPPPQHTHTPPPIKPCHLRQKKKKILTMSRKGKGNGAK